MTADGVVAVRPAEAGEPGFAFVGEGAAALQGFAFGGGVERLREGVVGGTADRARSRPFRWIERSSNQPTVAGRRRWQRELLLEVARCFQPDQGTNPSAETTRSMAGTPPPGMSRSAVPCSPRRSATARWCSTAPLPAG